MFNGKGTFHVDFEFFLVDLSISNNKPAFVKAQLFINSTAAVTKSF